MRKQQQQQHKRSKRENLNNAKEILFQAKLSSLSYFAAAAVELRGNEALWRVKKQQ